MHSGDVSWAPLSIQFSTNITLSSRQGIWIYRRWRGYSKIKKNYLVFSHRSKLVEYKSELWCWIMIFLLQSYLLWICAFPLSKKMKLLLLFEVGSSLYFDERETIKLNLHPSARRKRNSHKCATINAKSEFQLCFEFIVRAISSDFFLRFIIIKKKCTALRDLNGNGIDCIRNGWKT